MTNMRLAGVILDWAGTILDQGSRAPVATLRDVFASASVPITIAEARAPMGVAKRVHIEAILNLPRVRDAWFAQQGALPQPADTDRLYSLFIPRQLKRLKDHHTLIEGLAEAAQRMRSRGLAIGTTTGYTRPMLDYLLARAREQGFQPDAAFCPDDVSSPEAVPQGRPAPFMCFQNAIALGVYPMRTLVKIGDTPVDMEEGLNAGMWTIGITRTGNEVGLTADEWAATPATERASLLPVAEGKLRAAGAHYTAGSVAECDGILEEIAARIAAGDIPATA